MQTKSKIICSLTRADITVMAFSTCDLVVQAAKARPSVWMQGVSAQFMGRPQYQL